MSLKNVLKTLLVAILPAGKAMSQVLAPLPLPPIAIKLPENIQAMPIKVQSADFVVDVSGVLAETTATLVFSNPNARILEGELSFPLPDGATVAGYALDINGKMIDGVIVPKEKARVVFDELVRKGIDPGLAEQSQGNVFKTRIYPLPSRGCRTVKIRYVSKVAIVNDQGTDVSLYNQPLRFSEKLDAFKLKINVAAAQQPPKVVGGSLANMNFTNWQSIYTASVELKDILLSEDLNVAVMARPKDALAVQPHTPDTAYFSYDTSVDIAVLPQSMPLANPVVLWDASLSRAKSDHAKEFALLEQLLKGKTDIGLVVFRNAPEPFRKLNSADELLKALQNIVYDGGTRLADALTNIPRNSTALLFSDGFDNLSDTLASDADAFRLVAFVSDKDQNAPLLRGLAAKTGGACIDLRTVSTQDAVALVESPAPAVTAVLADGKDIFADAVWQLKNGRLAVAAPCAPSLKHVAVTLKAGDRTMTFDSAKADLLPQGTLVRTVFGQMKINRMLEDNDDEHSIAEAGKSFGLVTPYTSLLVLDSLQQYIQYNVRPPETLPEWRAAFDKRPPQKDAKDESFHLKPNDPAYVAGLWNALVEWHKHDFSKQPMVAMNTKAVTNTVNAMAVEDGDPVDGRRSSATMPTGSPRMGRRNAPQRLERSRSAAGRDNLPVMASAANDSIAFANAAPDDIAFANAAPDATRAANAQATPARSNPRTALQPWSPDTPYLADLNSHADNAYPVYLEARGTYGEAPGFYMDCADFFFAHKQPELALRILTNLAEIQLENKQLLRVLAYKLRFQGELKMAETVFRKVLKIAREEPQSYRDLALTLDDQEKFQEAADTMMTIVNFKFDSRFPEIETIALTEINRILARAKRKGVTVANVPENYIRLIDTDIRIVLNWDADMTDMDLWTTDPHNVKCFYSYRNTPSGGRNSCDFTQGYGPEEFMIRNALKGDYLIQANYYGSHSQKVLGPVTLYTEVFTNYGRADEKKQVLTYRLSVNREVVTVGKISHDGVNRPPRHDAPFQYQVKTGDTLASIAAEQLGRADAVADILKLNPALAPDKPLPVGTIMTLPATK